MQSFDVVVVGAGLAGLQCTRLLAGYGLTVLLVDRKTSLEQSVHTTGIFVRRSLEDFLLPPAYLGPPIRHVTLYSPARRTLELSSPCDEYRIGRMGALYQRWLGDCQAAGAQWRSGVTYLHSEPAAAGSLIHLRQGAAHETVQARYLVAADGTNSRVARDVGLSVNRHWIVGLEAVYEGTPLAGPPRLHCFLDTRVAPGYIAWIAEDGHSRHVGVGGYGDRFQPAAALERFNESLGNLVPLSSGHLVERRGGRIPVGGLLPKLANPRALLLGDAAGAASPLTAGGLDPCLRLSELAAKVIWQYLQTSDPTWLACYDGRRLGRRFRTRKAMRTALRWMGSNVLFEVACAAMRTAPGRRLAEKIFFGRGSFPDVDHLATPKSPPSALKAQQPQAVAVNQGL